MTYKGLYYWSFLMRNQRWPMDSHHKGTTMWKVMTSSSYGIYSLWVGATILWSYWLHCCYSKNHFGCDTFNKITNANVHGWFAGHSAIFLLISSTSYILRCFAIYMEPKRNAVSFSLLTHWGYHTPYLSYALGQKHKVPWHGIHS